VSSRVSVLIVSYNTREMTLACLRSLLNQTPGLPLEVRVVDNDSQDGSADAIAAEFPGVVLERSKVNLGFAAANNRAAAGAVGEYLLLLNPDTVVLDRAVERLVAFVESRPEAGIWGGRTVFADGRLNPTSCWARPTPWSLLCLGTGLSSVMRWSRVFNPEAYGGWQRDTVREVDIVTGCFLLIRRSLWERLGGFDRAFFMYGEEADLCLRARALGVRPVVTPEATIVHYGGASERVRADKLVRLLKAKALLVRRHCPFGTRWFGLWMLAQWCLVHSVAWRIAGAAGASNAASSLEFWTAGWRRRREWLPSCPVPPSGQSAATC
jgi:GT2 family glycosyltransferase